MHLSAFTTLLKNEALLNNIYLAANTAEFFLTALLFYLAAQIKKADKQSDERAFRLNHFLLTNNLIEELSALGRSPSQTVLQEAYQSLEFLRTGRVPKDIERHIESYEEYRRVVAEHVSGVSGEAGMRKILASGDVRRAYLEYAEIATFILLITFQVFSTWFIMRPEA